MPAAASSDCPPSDEETQLVEPQRGVRGRVVGFGGHGVGHVEGEGAGAQTASMSPAAGGTPASRARSRKRCTAGASGSTTPGGGSASGPRRNTASPGRSRGARLVTSTVTVSEASSSRATVSAAASLTCSQLSTSSRTGSPRNQALRSRDPGAPGARARAGIPGSRMTAIRAEADLADAFAWYEERLPSFPDWARPSSARPSCEYQHPSARRVERGRPGRRPFVEQGVPERVHLQTLPDHGQVEQPAAEHGDDQGR
jgi:hypothetical protein